MRMLAGVAVLLTLAAESAEVRGQSVAQYRAEHVRVLSGTARSKPRASRIASASLNEVMKRYCQRCHNETQTRESLTRHFRRVRRPTHG